MIESTGANALDELTRAAPMRTSFTTMPLTEAKVCVTRRTHEPQCMPSICNVTDVKTAPPGNSMIRQQIRCETTVKL